MVTTSSSKEFPVCQTKKKKKKKCTLFSLWTLVLIVSVLSFFSSLSWIRSPLDHALILDEWHHRRFGGDDGVDNDPHHHQVKVSSRSIRRNHIWNLNANPAAMNTNAQQSAPLSNATFTSDMSDKSDNHKMTSVDSTSSSSSKATATLCLVVKDPQLKYINEWADYHFALGFTDLHLFDNSLEFSLTAWGHDKPYAQHIYREHYLPGTTHDVASRTAVYRNKTYARIQDFCYHACVQRALARNVTWVATLDLDEFVVLKRHATVQQLLEEHCPNQVQVTQYRRHRKNKKRFPRRIVKECGQLSLNWVPVYGLKEEGSNNHNNRRIRSRYVPVPVTKRFQNRTRGAVSWVKALAKPEAIDLDQPWLHTFALKKPYVWLDTSGTVLKTQNQRYKYMHNKAKPAQVAVLYHYRTRSLEEAMEKHCERGDINNFTMTCPSASSLATLSAATRKSLVWDDGPWQTLRRLVPSYQQYDNVTDLG